MAPSSPRARSLDPQRRDPRRARREAQLVDAALRCISTLGLRDTTVQDVATRAGMAVGSISQYFETKEALFTAALRALSEQFEAAWRCAIAEAGADATLRLRRFVECYFEPSICQRRNIAVWFAFWGEVKARPQYRAVCADYDRRHDEALEELCRAVIADDQQSRLAPRPTAKIIASTCHGLWLELLTGTDDLDREDLASLARTSLGALFPSHAPLLTAPAGSAYVP